jgi:hypothetical protein
MGSVGRLEAGQRRPNAISSGPAGSPRADAKASTPTPTPTGGSAATRTRFAGGMVLRAIGLKFGNPPLDGASVGRRRFHRAADGAERVKRVATRTPGRSGRRPDAIDRREPDGEIWWVSLGVNVG